MATNYDPFYHLVSLPFAALRVPRIRLRIPSVSLPSTNTVFCVLLLSYFLVVSGFLYDVITAPPGIGGRHDPKSGAVIPEVFMAGRLNGQYIIEGLSSGFMFLMGGIGLILLDFGCDKTRARNTRATFVVIGASLIAISYSMTMLFLRIKVPGYLR